MPGAATAFEPMAGCFIADAACPALPSIRRQDDPGAIATEPERAYPLVGANRAKQATHLQIVIKEADPRDRWVEVGCGRIVEACELPGGRPAPPTPPAAGPAYVLAATWQPAFCERQPATPECRSQTAARFDAAHLALHGLWPEPRTEVYCGVGPARRSADQAGRWAELPPVELTERTRAELETAMPGTRSDLDRHEWLKHGSCYSATAEEYFAEALQLMRQLNASPVRTLLATRIGARVTRAQLRAAFDQAFGAGAGARVALSCERGLITELLINLRGTITLTTPLADLIAAAQPRSGGCAGGRVDRAGFRQ